MPPTRVEICCCNLNDVCEDTLRQAEKPAKTVIPLRSNNSRIFNESTSFENLKFFETRDEAVEAYNAGLVAAHRKIDRKIKSLRDLKRSINRASLPKGDNI